MNRLFSPSFLIFVSAMLTVISSANAVPLNLAREPLFVGSNVAPLNMLVLGRDHKLYYEAYNDASDLNGDGIIDVGYQGYQGYQGDPTRNIDYYGYFNSYACYDYDGASLRFIPIYVKSAAEIAAKDKTCHNVAGGWSGDFLNYITTARMDALRKVLYGGYRSTDTGSLTILQRTHIPHDAHAWGKEFSDTSGYDIRHYTALNTPASGTRHLFANVSLSEAGPPLMRILNDSTHRVWEWLSKERPVADTTCIRGINGPTVSCSSGSSVITNYELRIESCKSGVATVKANGSAGVTLSDTNCQNYGSSYKPTGVLHEFGENNSMYFGLMSGTYAKNLEGGVLRKKVSSFTDEINPADGTFTSMVGIVKTIDRLHTVGFDYSSKAYNCGWITTRSIINGECNMWGNPIAEMMYESLRYFSGKAAPTTDFNIGSTGNSDAVLGLPLPAWNDPYSGNDAALYCAKPFQMIISDINPSFDSDKVPGSYFNPGFTGDINGLNASTLADTITAYEGDVAGMKYIGQSAASTDGTPSPKNVLSLGSIRGLAPEEPTKQGSYYSASVAYHGLTHDISSAQGNQNLQTFSVALASPLPHIKIPSGTGNVVTIVPFAKSVGGSGISAAQGAFQPTNQIVDFYVESLTATSGSFLINYEDVEQGADHDMDAIARYTYALNSDGTITVNVDSVYAAGGIDQHLGYIISGTTADGIYLEVKDQGGANVVYFLDTPASRVNPSAARGTSLLTLNATRTFTPSLSPAADLLKGPLWYAAKWGGFTDSKEGGNANQKPDGKEWDANEDGDPDNYFLVTNALDLSNQLRRTFREIIARNGSSASVAVNSVSLRTGTLVFQALFNSDDWSGQLKAFNLTEDGEIGTIEWLGEEKLAAQLSSSGGHAFNRKVITMNTSNGKGIPFTWPRNYTSPLAEEFSIDQINGLLQGVVTDQQNHGRDLVNYLRGEQLQEQGHSASIRDFRPRDTVLGDIVNSDPVYIRPPAFFFPDAWPSGSPENQISVRQKYSEFRSALKTRKPLLVFGGNDGMLHFFNANHSEDDSNAGKEVLAYVPGKIYNHLYELADPSYSHRYFVDGKLAYSDAFFSRQNEWRTALIGTLGAGGQGLYALDVTDPEGTYDVDVKFDESSADNLSLWEFTDADDADLGYNLGRPAIGRLANGKWVAIFGNGYNNTELDDHVSTTGNAVLYVVDIETKAIIKKLDTKQGTAQDPLGQNRPNGLSTPVLIDIQSDSIVEYVYAGDLFGNLWKFDLTSISDSGWGFSYGSLPAPEPLFVAKDALGNRLPITTRPQVSRHSLLRTGNNFMVFFGTGKYIEVSDNLAADQNTQSFFGVWDDGTNTAARSNMLGQSITFEDEVAGYVYRVTTDYEARWTDEVNPNTGLVTVPRHRGWYLDLLNTSNRNTNNFGERQVSDPILRNDRLIFTTLIPSTDPCDYGGSSWIMELDPKNGGALDFTPFDVNDDGLFTLADMIDTDGDGVGDKYPSAIGTGDAGGFAYQPVILDDSDQRERKLSSMSSGSIRVIEENPLQKTKTRNYWREVNP